MSYVLNKSNVLNKTNVSNLSKISKMWFANNFGDDDVPPEHVEGRQVVVTLRLVLDVVDNLGHGLQVRRAQLFSVCVRNLNIKITKPSHVSLHHFKPP